MIPSQDPSFPNHLKAIVLTDKLVLLLIFTVMVGIYGRFYVKHFQVFQSSCLIDLTN